LSTLTFTGSGILKALTDYVVGEGFNAKIRELRSEFYSREEFNLVEMKLIKMVDLDTAKSDLQSQINSLKTNFKDLETKEVNIINDLHDTVEKMKKLASIDKLDSLEYNLMNKASISEMNAIAARLEEYLSFEEWRRNKYEIDTQLNNLDAEVSIRLKESEFKRKTNELKDKIQKTANEASQKKDCIRDKAEWSRHIEKIRDEMEKIRKEIKKIQNTNLSINKLIDAKCDRDDIDEVN
jgi:DNA repair exonuclease SbcCD ATPase subunit